MKIDPRKEPRFEEIYPQAPYSELIRLAIAAAAFLRKAVSERQELSSPRLNTSPRDLA